MFGHDAFILDRHVIAGELDHPRVFRTVPGVERQRRHRHLFVHFLGFAHRGLPSLTWRGTARCPPSHHAPSVTGTCEFSSAITSSYPLGRRGASHTAIKSVPSRPRP